MKRFLFPLVLGVLVLGVLFGVGTVFATSILADDDDDELDCEKIKAKLTSEFTGELSTAGVIEGDLEGTTSFAGQSAVPGPRENTLAYTGTLTITTDDGILTTFGTGVFEAFASGAGSQFDQIVDGTGEFQGATGLLFFNFTANDEFTGFTSDVRGEICTPDSDDDDDDDDDNDDDD